MGLILDGGKAWDTTILGSREKFENSACAIICASYEFSRQDSPIKFSRRSIRGRVAFLLIGGDETGSNRWYKQFIPRADNIYDAHLRRLKHADH